MELNHYSSFLRRAITTRYFTLSLQRHLVDSLRMQHEPHPVRHYRQRDARYAYRVSSLDTATPPDNADSSASVSTSSKASAKTKTSSTRGARQAFSLPLSTPSLCSDERYRLVLLEKTGLRRNYDDGPPTADHSPESRASPKGGTTRGVGTEELIGEVSARGAREVNVKTNARGVRKVPKASLSHYVLHAFNGAIELPPQEFPWPRTGF